MTSWETTEKLLVRLIADNAAMEKVAAIVRDAMVLRGFAVRPSGCAMPDIIALEIGAEENGTYNRTKNRIKIRCNRGMAVFSATLAHELCHHWDDAPATEDEHWAAYDRLRAGDVSLYTALPEEERARTIEYACADSVERVLADHVLPHTAAEYRIVTGKTGRHCAAARRELRKLVRSAGVTLAAIRHNNG